MKKRQVVLFEPYKQQREVLDALSDDSVKYVTVVCGRQVGKSTLAMNQTISWALNDNNSIIYWISPTDNQIQKVFRDILSSLEGTGVIHGHKNSKGDVEITFINNSKVYLRTAGSEDSLRGESVNYLIVDEAAFIKKQTVYEILLPMLTVKGKKALFISTPKGKNWLYDFFKVGFTDPRYRSFRFRSEDSPFSDKDFLRDMRNIYTESIYNQEFNGEFIDSAAVFANIDSVMILDPVDYPDYDDSYFGGIDIGIVNDSTVFSVLDSKGNLVKTYCWTSIETPLLIDKLIDVFNRWKFKKVFIESNNQGVVIYQTIKNKVRNLYPFYTSRTTKPEMINNLIFAFNMKQIKIVKDENLRTELESFIMTNVEGAAAKFAAASGFTDDYVMSLAIARQCWKSAQSNRASMKFY